MKKSLILGVALGCAVISTSASAEENWTGPYLGASVGYINAKGSTLDLDGYDYNRDYLTSKDGVLGSVNAGYNFQDGNIVYGLEADIGLNSAKGQVEFYGPSYDSCDYCAKNEIKALGSVRARLGVATGKALIYATGGLAYGKVKNYWAYEADNASEDKWHAGWTVGGGVDYAVDSNLSVRVEGLHYNLGRHNVVSTDTDYSVGFKNTANVVRFGVNYGF